MVLPLIDDDEVRIDSSRKKYYVQFNFRDEMKEIHLDIKNFYLRDFYKILGDRIDMLEMVFAKIFNMPPSERTARITTLPDIPLFLQGDNHFNLEVNKKQSEVLTNIARLLNTSLNNWNRIVYYISIPEHLYAEYPYLGMHYKFLEMYLNYYMEELDQKFRFTFYDSIKKSMDNWKN